MLSNNGVNDFLWKCIVLYLANCKELTNGNFYYGNITICMLKGSSSFYGIFTRYSWHTYLKVILWSTFLPLRCQFLSCLLHSRSVLVVPSSFKNCPLTFTLLVANLANTKWCKKPEKDWNPGIWVFIWDYSVRASKWIPTWQGLDGKQKSLHPCALDESSLSNERVKKF